MEQLKNKIIDEYIKFTGIEDEKTCLDVQGAKDLCLDVWNKAEQEGKKEIIEEIISAIDGDNKDYNYKCIETMVYNYKKRGLL